MVPPTAVFHRFCRRLSTGTPGSFADDIKSSWQDELESKESKLLKGGYIGDDTGDYYRGDQRGY